MLQLQLQKKNPFLLKSNHSKVHASQSVISGDQNLIPTQWFYFGSGDAITFCQTCPDDTLYMTEIDNVQQNQMSYISYNPVNPGDIFYFLKPKVKITFQAIGDAEFGFQFWSSSAMVAKSEKFDIVDNLKSFQTCMDLTFETIPLVSLELWWNTYPPSRETQIKNLKWESVDSCSSPSAAPTVPSYDNFLIKADEWFYIDEYNNKQDFCPDCHFRILTIPISTPRLEYTFDYPSIFANPKINIYFLAKGAAEFVFNLPIMRLIKKHGGLAQ